MLGAQYHTIPQGPASVYAILTPLFRVLPHDAARQIAFFANYHAHVGFNSTILYERGSYIRHLHYHRGTVRCMHRGFLKVCNGVVLIGS